MSSYSPPSASGSAYENLASASEALIDGTQTIINYSVPGNTPYLIAISADKVVSSAETGGEIALAIGGVSAVTQIITAGKGVGAWPASIAAPNVILAPGTSLEILQQTALTAGASVANVELWGIPLPFSEQASATNFALQDATPTICSYTTPNDGNQHYVYAQCAATVVSPTGGEVLLVIGTDQIATLLIPSEPTGSYFLNNNNAIYLVPPNTTVTIEQFTALTAGSATVTCSIWGD